jgi:hypothetical protein
MLAQASQLNNPKITHIKVLSITHFLVLATLTSLKSISIEMYLGISMVHLS